MDRYLRWINIVRREVREACGLDSTVEQTKHLHVRFTKEGAQRVWTWRLASTPSAQGANRSALRELVNGLRETFGADCLRVQDFTLQDFVSAALAEQERKRKLEAAWEAFHLRLSELRIPDAALIEHQPDPPTPQKRTIPIVE